MKTKSIVLVVMLTLSFTNVRSQGIITGVTAGIDILTGIGSSLDILNDSKDIILLTKIYELSRQVEDAKKNVEWVRRIEYYSNLEKTLTAMICTQQQFNMYRKFMGVGACGKSINVEFAMMNLSQVNDLIKLALSSSASMSQGERQHLLSQAGDKAENVNNSLQDIMGATRDDRMAILMSEVGAQSSGSAYSYRIKR